MDKSVYRLPVGRRLPNKHNAQAANHESFKWSEGRMYAISFDLDTKKVAEHYNNDKTAAYSLIETVFRDHGFNRKQGSVYFGDKAATSVTCVLAVQDLVRRHPKMRFVVRDIRMLRVEENNDLAPALGQPDLLDEAGVM